MTPSETTIEGLSGLGERISSLADKLGGRRNLAKKIETSETQLYRYIAGKQLPGIKALIEIADAGGVSVEWLATGRGSPDGGGDTQVEQLKARVAELEAELEQVRNGSLDNQTTILVRRLGLEELTLMARRGGQATAWRVMRCLATAYPEALSLEALRVRTGLAEMDLRADLAVLVRDGLAVQDDGRYRAADAQTRLRTRGTPDASQAAIEAIRVLLHDVLPEASRERGYLSTTVLTVASEDSAVERVYRSLLETCADLEAPSGAETVTVVLGVGSTSD